MDAPVAPAEPERDPAEARRDQILEAAIAVFGERGFQRATIKEIAGRAGVAPGTIYLYFKNKHDLLVAIADTIVTRNVDEMLAHSLPLNAEAFIATIMRDRLRFARHNVELVRALVAEIWTDRELQEIFVAQVIAPVFALAGRYTALQVQAGKLRPFRQEIVLPAIIGGVAAVSLLRLGAGGFMPADYDEETLVAELTRLYLHGLQPQREEGEP